MTPCRKPASLKPQKNKGPRRHNVKSANAVDAHERKKDLLDSTEMNRLLTVAKKSRHGQSDHLLILMMYRHGLRVSEAISLRIDAINLKTARLWVEGLKGGLSVEHPIENDELREIKSYLETRQDDLPWLFVSERGSITRQAVNCIIAHSAKQAKLPHVHPHMLRNSCGYYLANSKKPDRLIQDYLGHRNPIHTRRYTGIAGSQFEGLWSK